MLTDKTSCVSSCRTGFGSEAGRVGAVLDRKLLAVKNFVAVHVGNGNLSGRNQEVIVGKLESVLFKLRKLTRTRHGSTVDHERRENFGVTAFDVGIEEKVDNRAFQSCP